MSINYISNNFGHIATTAQYNQYMRMDLERINIYTALRQLLKTIADNSDFLTNSIEERCDITTIDTDELIEQLEELSEGDYDINTDSELLQQFKSLQQQYKAQDRKIMQFRQDVINNN